MYSQPQNLIVSCNNGMNFDIRVISEDEEEVICDITSTNQHS